MKQFFKNWWKLFIESGVFLFFIFIFILMVFFYFTPGNEPGAALCVGGLIFIIGMNTFGTFCE